MIQKQSQRSDSLEMSKTHPECNKSLAKSTPASEAYALRKIKGSPCSEPAKFQGACHNSSYYEKTKIF